MTIKWLFYAILFYEVSVNVFSHLSLTELCVFQQVHGNFPILPIQDSLFSVIRGFLRFHLGLTIAHRLDVLLFGMTDIANDFFIHSEHQLLGEGHGSDCI